MRKRLQGLFGADPCDPCACLLCRRGLSGCGDRPSFRRPHVGRIGVQLALGAWFIVAAWILYRSGWDFTDPVREGWTYMIFSWTAIGASVLTLGARLAARLRSGA